MVMFDLKKRNSLTLKGSHETEEFRRVAVRRKDTGTVGDCSASGVNSGMCGSYSWGHACDGLYGPKLNSQTGAEEDDKKHPAKISPFKPEVPPKPAHLQSPPMIGWDQTCSPATGKLPPEKVGGTVPVQTPHRDDGGSFSCISPPQHNQASPSPVRGGGDKFLSAAPRLQISPAIQPQVGSKFTKCPVLGSPSPGKRGIQSCSPLREGGHSPAKLSPRNHSPLMGKLRTPSPVQKRMSSYSPAKYSKSWLGLNRITSDKMETQEKKTEKSLSVPDLVVYMDENRIPNEKAERPPLKQLQPADCNRFGINIGTPSKHRVSCPTDESHSSSIGVECSPGQMNGAVLRGMDDTVEEGKKSTSHGSKFSCEWTKTVTGNERVSKAFTGRENEKEEKMNEDDTEEKLYKIANELLQTERAYVARLHLLDQVFCLRLTEEADRGSFPSEVIRNIFSNTSSIYSFHSQFLLPDLENCICHWGESPGLGKALLQHAPFLRMYADYVRNFDQAMELVRTWTERSSAFRNIIQDIQGQDVCGNLTLQHHMLEPVQRVPRYEMLLKDYLKKLPEDNPDYDLAQRSLQAISMAATHSNSAIERAESLKRLLEIYEMVGEEEVVNPTNVFLREGRLLKLAARNTSAMERHLFLFNNFLLCCTPKFSLVGQRFTVRCRIGVDGMQVHQTTNEDHLYTFQVSGKEKTLELQASSEQDRDQWIKVIQEAIDLFVTKNKTFKLASKEQNEEDPNKTGFDLQRKELGRRAPRWIRDNEVTLCMTCQEPFNALTRRRHHCRACGFVVCWKCSDYKVALEYDGNKLNKVCKACYLILTGLSGEKVHRKKRRTLESETHSESSDSILSSTLHYSANFLSWQQVWCVLTRTDPPVLHVHADSQTFFTIPLLGCTIMASPQELQDQHSFCVKQSKTTHMFSCDGLELKQNWLTVLKVAVTGRIPDDNIIGELSSSSIGDGRDKENNS